MNKYDSLSSYAERKNINKKYFLNDKYIDVIYDIFILENYLIYTNGVDLEITAYIGLFHI